ncbi:DNA polymerase epsilon subunit 2-like [Sinocyclocheilus rhinocerous]|uniref:DNA polymerase epsilon subunit 2-like n=1 Tax=Sinocyclocheilus rhinocerous TaxID=307959 RepID=UPI0007B8F5EC|nr:PREDICTED: DNA polymerase epsilon subunit 2-like [Sinocyclocheilus rhinocerous]
MFTEAVGKEAEAEVQVWREQLKMDARRVKQKVSAGFKMRGLILRPESSRLLLRVLESVTEADLEEVLERILDAVEKQPLGSSMVELSVVEAAVQDCSQACDETIDNVFNIIGAFDVPRFIFSTERKKFVPISMTNHPVPKLCGQSRDKAELFRERYTILQQRTHRHELFTPPVIGSAPDEGRNKFQLKTVEALLGSTAKVGEVIVLGMITQLKEGKFYLEDPSGAVQLNMSKAQFHSGLYTESCFVLAEGWYEDSVFHVNAFGFPPTEPSSFTRAYYGNINFFGGPSSTAVKASAKLKQLEEENEDAMFVIVSDVWLDRVEVLEKIQTMFSGYSAMPPTCFIFCGNFSSAPYGRHQLRTLKESFKALADLICEYPSIHNSSRFVFVPGPEDPGPGTVLPRKTITPMESPHFSQKQTCVRVRVSVFVFVCVRRVSSMCSVWVVFRIQYCSQEMVVIREDLVNKMCRNCVRLPSSNLDIPSHFVKTILSQGHVTPLPLYVCPVHWPYDYALRVYPVPDVIVFADKYDPFNVCNTDCLCINPGSFPRSGFSFKVYYPSNRTVEDSKLQGL